MPQSLAFDAVVRRFRDVAPAVDFCSLRVVDERTDLISVSRDVLESCGREADVGAMVTVHHRGGIGYAGTPDLSASGLRRALATAQQWAEATAGNAVTDFSAVQMPAPSGEYESPVTHPWESLTLAERVELVLSLSRALHPHEAIVDWGVSLWSIRSQSLYVTADGGRVMQTEHIVSPDMHVVAHKDGRSQRRSFGGRGLSQQGGLEVLDRVAFTERGPRLAEEALALLDAPNCPTDRRCVLLAPDQMMLQIHESIGHPLELDRILGDERNYAGTSFVTLDMFGSYRYGSELLDVTFDPGRSGQLASYGFDAEGAQASKQFIIRGGVLERPLGSVISSKRAGLAGVANARASSWNRAPIDRMANLNLEAGTSSLDELIARVERGVLMRTNTSWSIDDSRNKFQFGCEWGQLIEDGALTHVVRNPNYRGRSATFWRNLIGVGGPETLEVKGTPYCGKGEPNQIIRVGHASPFCLFRDVAVFGGA